MANLAIRGHATRGREVIELLKMLGGKNTFRITDTCADCYYRISSGDIYGEQMLTNSNTTKVFSLEEFLEKFPYKVGDKVQNKGATSCGSVFVVKKLLWEDNQVKYIVNRLWYNNDEVKVTSKILQPYKEETMDKANKAVFDANAQCCDIMNHLIKEKAMEEIKVDIPKGSEFAGVDDDKQQVIFENVKSKYPKTYRKCAEIVGFNIEEEPTIFGYKEELLDRFQKLLICRDAYWKISGEEMGLGKPWEPDWTNHEFKYCIKVLGNTLKCVSEMNIQCTLAFPTEEMRDAFFENFKDLIESCKELL